MINIIVKLKKKQETMEETEEPQPVRPILKRKRCSINGMFVLISLSIVSLLLGLIITFRVEIQNTMEQSGIYLPTTTYFNEKLNYTYYWIEEKACGHRLQNTTSTNKLIQCTDSISDPEEHLYELREYKKQEYVLGSVLDIIDTIDTKMEQLKKYRKQLLEN